MNRFLFLCIPLILLAACSDGKAPVEPVVEVVEKGTGSVIIEQQYPTASGAILKEEIKDLCVNLVSDEQDHCYQQKASDSGDVTICNKIQGERFAHITGNPPRDKCFSMVALKKCDPTICDYIQGGQSYFSPTECKQRVSRYCS